MPSLCDKAFDRTHTAQDALDKAMRFGLWAREASRSRWKRRSEHVGYLVASNPIHLYDQGLDANRVWEKTR